MMQDLVEATHIAITKAVWIAMFQLLHYWIRRKLNLILKLEVATLNEQISHLLHIILLQILSVFISHCYHESPRGELFFETQCRISCRWSLPSPTDPVWWRSMHAISSYRGNRPTNKQTHKQTQRQWHTQTGRTDYNTLRH